MVDLFMNGMIVIVLWYVAIYALKLDRIEKIDHNPNKTELFNLLNTMAWVSILTVFLVRVLSLFFGDASWLQSIQNVISVSFFSRLLTLAALFLVFDTAHKISLTVLRCDRHLLQDRKESIAFANGLIALAFSGLLLGIQHVLTGAYRQLYDGAVIHLPTEIIIGILFYALPCLLIIINGFRYIYFERVSREVRHLLLPIMLFVGLGYYVVITAVSVYEGVRYILKKIGKTTDDDDDVLLLGTSLHERFSLAKINSYVLLGTFVIFVVLIYLGSTPYPIQESAYSNGAYVFISMVMSIIAYWVLELLARRFSKVSLYLRLSFFPLLAFFVVGPFFTSHVSRNPYMASTFTISIYHQILVGSEYGRILFFFSLFGFVAAIAYLMHLFAGEMDMEKHALSLIPIFAWPQVLISSLMYPYILTRPPYFLMDNRILLYGLIGLLSAALIVFVGGATNQLFNAPKSRIRPFIPQFLHKTVHVYLATGLITLMVMVPMVIQIHQPVYDMNTSVTHSTNLFNSAHYQLVGVEPIGSDQVVVIAKARGGAQTLIQVVDLATLAVVEESILNQTFESYRVMGLRQIAFLLPDQAGAFVFDIRRMSQVWQDLALVDTDYEYLDYTLTAEGILVTKHLNQFYYDYRYGEVVLEVVGNNFFKTIPGEVTYLHKNQVLYQVQGGILENLGVSYEPTLYDFIYAYSGGFLAHQNQSLILLATDLRPQTDLIYYDVPIEAFSSMMRQNNKVILHHDVSEKGEVSLYDLSTFERTYLDLTQKIYTNYDVQKLYLPGNGLGHMLFDHNQITWFIGSEIYARQWLTFLDEDRTVSLFKQPIMVGDGFVVMTYQGYMYQVMPLTPYDLPESIDTEPEIDLPDPFETDTVPDPDPDTEEASDFEGDAPDFDDSDEVDAPDDYDPDEYDFDEDIIIEDDAFFEEDEDE